MAAWCSDCGAELSRFKKNSGHMDNCPKVTGKPGGSGNGVPAKKKPHPFAGRRVGTVTAANGDVIRSYRCAVCERTVVTVNNKSAPGGTCPGVK